jgi:hypothetical protein
VWSPEGCTLFFFPLEVKASGGISGVMVLVAWALDTLEEDAVLGHVSCGSTEHTQLQIEVIFVIAVFLNLDKKYEYVLLCKYD